ncbi:MAG: hypothetical protein IPP77_12505 [Bacteroidetes bacterium]|nr:hypothetical protein [Bacteroidota bacterium]
MGSKGALRKAIVLHADILGFKSILDNSVHEGDYSLKKLIEALDQGINTLNLFKDTLDQAKLEVNTSYKLFSDNLYASFSYQEGSELSFGDAFTNCILFARAYFSIMLDNEFPIRGGISFGDDYSDEKMIFSPALADAYELETKKAIYPRIVIAEALIEKVKNNLQLRGDLVNKAISKSLLMDTKGVYFLNPTGFEKELNIGYENLDADQVYKGFVSRGINFCKIQIKLMEAKNDSHAKEKYEWLLDVLTWYLNDQKTKPKETIGTIAFQKI